MLHPLGRSLVPAAPVLVLAALAWSGGALAGAPATSSPPSRLWSAPGVYAVTRERPGPGHPTLELHRRPIDVHATPLCQTSVFQGGPQDCFVPYQDCSLDLQVSRAGGGLTLNVRKAEGADCPSDLPAAWRLTGNLSVVQLVRADFVARVRYLESTIQDGKWRPPSGFNHPVPDAELLRLFDAATPFLTRGHESPRSLMAELTSAVAELANTCKTADNTECVRSHLRTRFPKLQRGGREAAPPPVAPGDPEPTPASMFALPKGQKSELAGVWTRPVFDLNYLLTVSARSEGGQLHVTVAFQKHGSSGGLRELASFPSIECSGASVRQGWSKLACTDERALQVKLQGTRLLVRALSTQWDTSAAPALHAEEELHRVEPLALEAAFLRYPLESWGIRHYPWDLEQNLRAGLEDWLKKRLAQKVGALLRARGEAPETLSATRAFNLLSVTTANLLKRCPAEDPARNACIERELPEAFSDAHRTVGSAAESTDG